MLCAEAVTFIVRSPLVDIDPTISEEVGAAPSTQEDAEFQFPPAIDIVLVKKSQPVFPETFVEAAALHVAPPVAVMSCIEQYSSAFVPEASDNVAAVPGVDELIVMIFPTVPAATN